MGVYSKFREQSDGWTLLFSFECAMYHVYVGCANGSEKLALNLLGRTVQEEMTYFTSSADM